MAKYTGRIKLVILEIAGTVCDESQDQRAMRASASERSNHSRWSFSRKKLPFQTWTAS